MTQAAASARLAPDDLYRVCDAGALGFETTSDVTPIQATVGQERALQSLDFGLRIRAEGYNLFVAGPPGSGRNSALRAVVSAIAQAQPVPPDWCYVYNFRDSRQPSVLSLPAGRGRALAHDMDRFVDACRREIPRHFESDAFVQQREQLARELSGQRDQAFAGVEREAQARGFALNIGPMGVATIPLKPDGQPMSREEFGQLGEEERKTLQSRGEELQSMISQAMLQARRLEREAQHRLDELDKSVGRFAITPLLNELRQEYMDIPKALEYLDQVHDDIVEHLMMFRPGEEQPQAMAMLMRGPAEEFFARYKVNTFVTNSDGGAPVVIENNPAYYNLFGRIDYRAQLGAATTDHTMIKAGAVHRANGGYLVLQAYDLLISPLAWETLKRTLRAAEGRIENLGEQYSAIPVATLNPEPVPLDVKVVLVGVPRIFQMLQTADEDFRRLFRVKADFGVDMDRSKDCMQLYAGFISSRVRMEGLRHFHKSAVARVIEHGSRLVEHQNKLSTRFIDVADLLTEADYWAGVDKSDVVQASHVNRAIEEKVYRSNLIEERVQDLIDDGTIMIDTSRAVIGQVNGLSVFELGDYTFGRPNRITARVSLGRGQVVNIERETQLAGKIHNKGFLILNGYLQGKFAQERTLSLSASIGFEQVYNEIDGDSASAAELYVLLSALSGVPIKQGTAVTGSVNQLGEVQAIGGVNEKIEGFYAVCKAQGLNGAQGVVIPRENVKHLMLRSDVVAAVRDGKFNLWAVSNVDEGIELLTGVPAGVADATGRYPPGTVNRLAMDRLTQMSRKLAAAARRRGRRGAKSGSNSENQDA